MTDSNQPADKPVTTRQDLEQRIIAKAWKDPKFKEQLLKDPKTVVQQEVHAIDASVTLPDNLQIHVHEESAVTRHLVLPRNPSEFPAQVTGGDPKAAAPARVGALRIG